MKFTFHSHISAVTFSGLTTAAVLGPLVLTSVQAQQPGKEAAAAARQAIAAQRNSANDADAPLSREKGVAVMVEFTGAPAATAYAQALRIAQEQVDAQRNYALAHPKLRSSKRLLAKPAVATTVNAITRSGPWCLT